MIEHVSEVELFNILSTLEKIELWNHEISVDEMVVDSQLSPQFI